MAGVCPDDWATNGVVKPRLNVKTTYTDTDLVLTLKITKVDTLTAGLADSASIETAVTARETGEILN